jgi:hypothetical protein
MALPPVADTAAETQQQLDEALPQLAAVEAAVAEFKAQGIDLARSAAVREIVELRYNLRQLVALLKQQLLEHRRKTFLEAAAAPPSSFAAAPSAATPASAPSATVLEAAGPTASAGERAVYGSFFDREGVAVAKAAPSAGPRTRYHQLAWNEQVTEDCRCLAPFALPWGGLAFHEVLVERIHADGVSCTVRFFMPLSEIMLNPCEIAMSSLRPIRREERLAVGGRCLVRTADSLLWSYGNVEQLEDTYAVVARICGEQGGSLRVALDHVRPLPCADADTSDTSASDYDLEEEENDLDEEEALTAARSQDRAKEHAARETIFNAFGAWENHTTGIGLRLMQRLGYVPGEGLGKAKQGRVEPVKALIVPQGAFPLPCKGCKGQALRAKGGKHFCRRGTAVALRRQEPGLHHGEASSRPPSPR